MRKVSYFVAATALLCGALLGAAPAIEAATPASTPNYQIGVVEAGQALPQAQALGIGWTRVPLPWASLEPSNGTWNFHYTKNDCGLLALAADGIVPVGVVETVPAWASAIPSQAPDGVPSGLSLPWNSPDNYWGQYMYSLARHYAGLINVWIIGNEISTRKSFRGSVMQMAEMIQVAYFAVKAANPVASIQAPGAPYWYDSGKDTNTLLTDLASLPGASENHDFINGINLHLYNTVQWNGLVFGYYRKILKEHGLGTLPIWLTETNAAPNAPEDPGITPNEQAGFLIENLADSLAYATHVEVYEMADPRSPVNYGLISATGAAGAAYTAVQTITEALAGTRFLSASVLPYEWKAMSNPAIVTFGGVQRLVQVVWDQGFKRTMVRLPAYATTATVIGADGTTRSIVARNGHFVLPLAPARHHAAKPPTNAPVGGPPLIVVQSVLSGQAGTPTTPPGNSPSQFALGGPGLSDPSAAAVPLTATQGSETAAVNPTNATVTITDDGQSVTVGGWGTGPGQLLGPSGVAIAANGTVYVTNSGANDVVAYSPTGQVVAQWGSYGTRAGHFNGPSGIAIGPDGSVYVADTLNQRVQIFSPTGQYEGQGSSVLPTRIVVTSPNQWQCWSPMQ